MALTQVQKPEGFVGVNGRLIITLSSDNVNEPKFRYKISLLSGASLISSAFVDPDPNDFGIFDCSPRLQGRVQAQLHDGNLPATRTSIFDLDAANCYVEPVGGHEEITVILDESFAPDVDSEPQEQGLLDTFTFTIYNGSTILEDGVNVNTGFGVMDAISAPCLLDVTKTDGFGFRNVNVGNDDRFCLAWFNDNEDSVEVIFWRMSIEFESGPSGTEDINVFANKVGAGDGTTVYFMCGPKDLSDFTGIAAANRPSSSTDWVKYTVQPFDGVTAIGGAYVFNRDDRCRYDNYQLAFANKHGAWNFQTFNLLSAKQIEATDGKSYVKQVGGTDYGNDEYGFDIYDREKTEYAIKTKVKIDMNTNWLSFEEAQDLEAVIYSRDVRMLLNGSGVPVPVVVSNRAHKLDKYKKLRQYKITVEVAQRYYNL